MVCERAMEADGDAIEGGENHGRALEFKTSGNEKFNKNDFKGAIADYKKGLRLEPKNCDLHANLSAAYLHLEKYIEAEEHAIYAIHLRPTFYKGYMRAAKAAHGKGMTRLSLKRLETSLEKVTDPDGVKELVRLKTQYTCYLGLESNAEKEPKFNDDDDSDEEDDEYLGDSCDDNNDSGDDDDDLPPSSRSLPIPNGTDKSTNESQPKQPTLQADKIIEYHEDASRNDQRDIVGVKDNSSGDQQPSSSDASGKNDVDADDKSGKESEKKTEAGKEGEPFLELAKELTKNPRLQQDRLELKELLKCGTEAYHHSNYRKAAECYKAARERVGIKLTDFELDERQLHVIKYAYCASLISSNCYDDIVKAIQELNGMEVFKSSIPAIYIQIARAYCKLNRFKNALEPLENIQEIIDNCPIFPTFTWPGTDKTIEETTPNGLKNAIKDITQQSRMSHKASAVCRFENCLKISTHILPSVNIYTSDPDFIGYVRMICEEKCHIEYHVGCWKAFKETGVEKVTDKDFLGGRCFTTDCLNGDGDPSVIVTIEIIDSDGQVKSVNKLDPKTVVDSKKARKKKGKQDEKEEKEKEKEKEKAEKTKKNKDKQDKIKKQFKPARIEEIIRNNDQIEEGLDEQVSTPRDPVQEMEHRLEAFTRLRSVNFGNQKSWYNPSQKFYGREDEKLKAAIGNYTTNSNDTEAVKTAKDFIFTYFQSILKEEGPLSLKEIETLWKDGSENFGDVKSVIPNMKSTAQLLLESPRFCQVESYICLLDQIDEAYKIIVKETAGVVKLLVEGPKTKPAKTNSNESNGVTTPKQNNHKEGTIIWESSSDEDSDEYSEPEFVSDSDSDASADEDPEMIYSDIEVIDETPIPLHQKLPPLLNPSTISVGDLLSNMTSFLDEFKLPTERALSIDDSERTKDPDECTSNDTADYMSAIGSPDNHPATNPAQDPEDPVDPAAKLLSSLNREIQETLSKDESGTSEKVEQVKTIVADKVEEKKAEVETPGVQEPNIVPELDKAIQSQVPVENQLIQTSARVIKNSAVQTVESDLYKEINKQLKELQVKLAHSEKSRVQVVNDLAVKDNALKQIKETHDETMAHCKKITKKYDDIVKTHQSKIAEFTKKEMNTKKTLDELRREMEQIKMTCGSTISENNQLKEKNASLMKDVADLREKWSSAVNIIKDNEKKQNSADNVTKARLLKSQQNQLVTIKAYWDMQVTLMKKRCVEKISEIQNVFKVLPKEDVEGLPSLAALWHNTQQWKEIMAKLGHIEPIFQTIEAKIAKGELMDDLTLAMLPVLPEEPAILSVDTIMREVMDKYSKKHAESVDKTNKLTLLVANQQLEIEKGKDAIQQYQQLLGSYQMAPRMQPAPMSTTSFGGLAMQFQYPPNLTSGNVPFSTAQTSSTIPTIPPPGTEPSSVGGQKTLAEVQALLQESSQAAASVKTSSKPMGEGIEFLSDISFMGPPLDVMKPPPMTVPPPLFTAPPPIHGVAHKVLQTVANEPAKKEAKLPEKPVIVKPEPKVPSREHTPTPAAVTMPTSGPPTPNTEKSKKKKKSKNEAKEVPLSVAVNVVSSSSNTLVNGTSNEDFENEWSIVTTGKVKGGSSSHTNEPKQKGKRKLLEQLQQTFPSVTLKDMDDVVKRLRELNNNTLSGLAHQEIENRVHRYISQRAKTKNWGLTKFMDQPWGNAGKQDINKPRPDLHLDECIVCLEAMTEKTKTKLDCNHEFHTQCLRKWLKEKRVCPLCNKFAAMPDEFPAL